MLMKKVVLKIGGSVLYKKENMTLNVELIRKYIELINDLYKAKHKIAIVVGGGKLARSIIHASEILDQVKTYRDILAVESTRIHALLFIASLRDKAYLLVPRSFEEISKALSTSKIVVSGGLQPGQSTSAVSALIAEYWRADILINLTDVEQVYDKDPHKHPDAQPIEQMTSDELLSIITQQEEEPGKYDLFDRVGCEIIKRSKIKLAFSNGSKPENVKRILNGEKIGTVVNG